MLGWELQHRPLLPHSTTYPPHKRHFPQQPQAGQFSLGAGPPHPLTSGLDIQKLPGKWP